MATVNFFIKKDKKNTLSTIFVRVKQGRLVDQTAKTPYLIAPENWNVDLQTVRAKSDLSNRDELTRNIKSLRRFLEDELSLDANLGRGWLATAVDRFCNPAKYKPHHTTLFMFIEEYINQSHNRINPASGKTINPRTILKYGTCFNYMKDLARIQKHEPDFADINMDYYSDFTEYLLKLHLATNTIGKQIAVLKGFLNAATEMRINNITDYKSRRFKVVSEDSEAVYLDEANLDKLYKLDLSNNDKLRKIRDLFLIGCWTGCRYSDLSTITPEQISGNMLFVEQEKTGNKVIIPLHPVVDDILNRYDGNLPKSPSNQKFNDYIKQVCKLAEINEPCTISITRGGKRISETLPMYNFVSSHTARRSFATNLYKSGFPSISIMKITGHKTERSFLKYIKVTAEEHAKLLQLHWAKQGGALRVV